MNKTIWLCWFQGANDPNIPRLNRVCIRRWVELNPDWEVNVLCNSTIRQYVPEFFDIVKNSPNGGRTAAARSDLLRILLLSKYGGTWVDASVFPTLPLSNFFHHVMNDTGFFTYRFIPRSTSQDVGDRETVSWFLCTDGPVHPLIESWKTAFIKKFKLQNRFHELNKWKYYTFHETLCELYDSNPQVKYTIDNMVQIDPRNIINLAGHDWEKRTNSYMYKRPNFKF